MEECITKRFFRQRKSCTTERPAAKSFKENTNCSHFRLDTVIKNQYKKSTELYKYLQTPVPSSLTT